MALLPDRLRIAVLQWDIRTDQVEDNLKTAAGLVAVAKAQSAHLAVLPEMWTRSFCEGNLVVEALCYRERLEWCRSLAQEHQLWLGAGTIPEPADTAAEERVYNTFHLITPTGEVVLKYRKIHLFPNTGEPRFFLAGTTVPQPVTAGNWVIGAGICYDLRFPELFRRQMRQGANVFVVPAQFPRPREEHFTLLARARAMENLAGLIAVNRSGSTPTLNFPGNSMVLDVWGNRLVEMTGSAGCAVAELDFPTLAKVRSDFPFLQDTPLLNP